MDKSLAAQKILLQQVQDLEHEGREIAEFMAEEKNALSECLREAESEVRKQEIWYLVLIYYQFFLLQIAKQRKELERLNSLLRIKDEETQQIVQEARESRYEFLKKYCQIQEI